MVSGINIEEKHIIPETNVEEKHIRDIMSGRDSVEHIWR